jgi:23S rRNA pseudouridine2604 synthase
MARGPRRDDERPARSGVTSRPRAEPGAFRQRDDRQPDDRRRDDWRRDDRRPDDRRPRPAAKAAPRPQPAPQAEAPPVRSPGPKPAPKQPAGSGERLSKRLGEMGLASRREADDWIDAGWVKVNGKMAVLGQRVTAADQIEIDPAARQQQAKQVTILLHKPIGYVSGQAEDGHEPAWVLVKPETRWEDDPSGIKHHAGHLRHLAPAGRLDIDSTGLLVLTQDGRVAKALIGDDSLIEKEYLVRVEHQNEGPVPASAIALLNHGMSLDGVQLKPAKVSWQNEEQLRFVLREGRKRQIRRMCELVGLKVLALKRVRIGRIPLAGLPVGQWRYLGPHEKF